MNENFSTFSTRAWYGIFLKIHPVDEIHDSIIIYWWKRGLFFFVENSLSGLSVWAASPHWVSMDELALWCCIFCVFWTAAWHEILPRNGSKDELDHSIRIDWPKRRLIFNGRVNISWPLDVDAVSSWTLNMNVMNSFPTQCFTRAWYGIFPRIYQCSPTCNSVVIYWRKRRFFRCLTWRKQS